MRKREITISLVVLALIYLVFFKVVGEAIDKEIQFDNAVINSYK